MSQETNDREEEYDDSRGSINVIYLRKLRDLEELVREKEARIDRLEKENRQLERQVEKWEELGVYGKASKVQVIKQAQRV